MCGRFNLRASPALMAEVFQLLREPDPQLRFNIAPTQSIAAVRMTNAGRELSMLRWGLVPFWAKDLKIGNSLINARAETVATKPAFRSAFKARRCLIPATGFYEWQKTGAAKQPYHIELRDGQPFAFAGLWASWKGGDNPVESCTIITTSANELMSAIHDRMPVVLPEENYDRWLDLKAGADELTGLLVPYPAAEMQATPISTFVNNARHAGPECLTPVG